MAGVSWIERAVEERLARAARDGELSPAQLAGKPLDDLDRQRPPGWWADRFVERERSHARHERAVAAATAARAGFWRARDLDALRSAVAAANTAIARANLNLLSPDRLEPFDAADIESRWQRLR